MICSLIDGLESPYVKGKLLLDGVELPAVQLDLNMAPEKQGGAKEILPWPEACREHIATLQGLGWDAFYDGPDQTLIFFLIEDKQRRVICSDIHPDDLASSMKSIIVDITTP